MPRLSRSSIAPLIAVLLIPSLALWAQQAAVKTKKRAAPPKFNSTETKRVFFDNIFAGDVLNGERPSSFGTAVATSGRPVTGGPAAVAVASPAAGGGGGGGWAKIITSSAIEVEIKATKKLVDQDISTPTDFAGKGYKVARRDFSVLALMFGIISEYDGEVRFKNDAPAAREVFARTAANAKVGTSQVFNEAKQRKQDLTDLLGGQGINTKENVDPKPTWANVAWRTPLMQRLEMGMEPRVQQWTADKNSFKANKEQIAHEAQVIAAIAQALMKEGMEDADAGEYKAFCERMLKAANDTVDAVKLDNDDGARQAVSAINKVCTECHENYRS